jgi:hypothetical protein
VLKACGSLEPCGTLTVEHYDEVPTRCTDGDLPCPYATSRHERHWLSALQRCGGSSQRQNLSTLSSTTVCKGRLSLVINAQAYLVERLTTSVGLTINGVPPVFSVRESDSGQLIF